MRAQHTLSNTVDEEASFFNTSTPAFYIDYFKLIQRYFEEGLPMNAGPNKKAVSSYATLVVQADGRR
jgi:hypothetical protein